MERSKMLQRALVASTLVFAVLSATGQQHPNQEKGFDPTKLGFSKGFAGQLVAEEHNVPH